jgi:ribonuclease HI
MADRPQRTKTAKRRPGGTLKDGERRRLAAESRARRGELPGRPVACCDGGLRGNRAAAAYVLMSAGGRVLAEEVRLVNPGTIEDVECAAVAAALERAAELRLDELEVRIDSQLVVDWLTAARRPQRSFRWVPRDENAHVDQLVWAALSD